LTIKKAPRLEYGFRQSPSTYVQVAFEHEVEEQRIVAADGGQRRGCCCIEQAAVDEEAR
jgi:hypothetical protein